uniref:Alpha-macroglobulin-like TED domain-containing protein n=1 Tax=Oryzias latipes TaxID=8090 RepID=A0A3P9MFW5_ORYLA
VVRAVMDVEMPEDVVPGSLHVKVAAMGNVLNRLVHNLGEPLDFPYENGDWNIASMAINIYVLNYLKETQQLEHSMKEEDAVNFLKKAYQTQLSFKDKSGAFSIFKSGPRSSWLTALVMVTLYQAQPYIFIDENVINEARKWLECQQRENGCFKESGKHLTKKKGGCAIDEVAYNAFILAAFLEMGVSPDDPVVKMGLCCLKESIKDLQNPFAAAVSAWVFTLAKDMEPRAQLLHYLDKIAIKEETSVFSSLLISSYVILAKLTVTGSPRDLRSASHTFKWLVEHLNYYSTFSSTQDTMVAVKAIALYSKCVYTHTWSSTVSIWSPNDKVVFQLTPHNKLLYQEMVLQDINGKYSVKMKGTACALVQVCVHLSCDKYLSGVDVEHVDYKDNRVFVYVRKVREILGVQLRRALFGGFFCPCFHCMSLPPQLHKNIPIIHKLHLVQEYFVFNNKAVNVLIYDYNNPGYFFRSLLLFQTA